MKIKKGFKLCPVLGKTMVIATGELGKTFTGMIKMNESSARIWRYVESGMGTEKMYAEYAKAYGISAEQARSDVDGVIGQMKEAGIFE